MSITLINGDNFTAILTKNKPQCEKGGEHKWDGDTILTFHNDDRVLLQREFDALSEKEKRKLNIASGECSCSKCRIGYMSFDNPFYL